MARFSFLILLALLPSLSTAQEDTNTKPAAPPTANELAQWQTTLQSVPLNTIFISRAPTGPQIIRLNSTVIPPEALQALASINLTLQSPNDCTGLLGLTMAAPNLKNIKISSAKGQKLEQSCLSTLMDILIWNRWDSAITSLDLSGTGIADGGAVEIADALSESVLTSLILINNQIGDKGAEALVHAALESDYKDLKILDLSQNPISPKMKEALVKKIGTKCKVIL